MTTKYLVFKVLNGNNQRIYLFSEQLKRDIQQKDRKKEEPATE